MYTWNRINSTIWGEQNQFISSQLDRLGKQIIWQGKIRDGHTRFLFFCRLLLSSFPRCQLYLFPSGTCPFRSFSIKLRAAPVICTKINAAIQLAVCHTLESTYLFLQRIKDKLLPSHNWQCMDFINWNYHFFFVIIVPLTLDPFSIIIKICTLNSLI